METTETLWRHVRGLPDGHRLFKLEDRDWIIAIADESGATPDQTDDGVLWLDMHRPLEAGPSGHCLIPLIDAKGGESSTATDVQTLLMLAADYNWHIVGAYGLQYIVTRER